MTNKTEALLYQKAFYKKAGILLNPVLKEGISLSIIGFLLGRVSIMEGLFPFGVSYFASVCGSRKRFLGVGIGVISGLLYANPGIESLRYILSIFLFTIIYVTYIKRGGKNLIGASFIIFGTTLLSSIFYIMIKGFLLFDILIAVFEAVMILILSLIFSCGMPAVMTHENNAREALTSEKVLPFAILGGLILVSISDFSIFGLSIKNIVEILVIFLAGYIGGVGLSSTSSIIFPLIYTITSKTSPVIIGVYAFGGILAGIFREMGKLGIAAGFFMGITLMNFYINSYTSIIVPPKDFLAALLFFMMIPKKVLNPLRMSFADGGRGDISRDIVNQRLVELTSEKLKDLSRVLNQLACAFNSVTAEEKAIGEKNLSKLYTQISCSICGDCHMAKTCWEREFYRTYREIFDLISVVEHSYDNLNEQDLSEFFNKRCVKVPQIIEMIRSFIMTYRKNYYIQKRMLESRKLVATQLEGVSRIVKDFAREMKSEFRFNKELEDRISLKLRERGIRANRVFAMDYGGGKTEVYIDKSSCYGKRHCNSEIPVVISEILRKKVVVKVSRCTLKDGTRKCQLRLIPAESYEVAVGVAAVPKSTSKVSGDTYSFNKLDNGRFMLAISDGMGIGEEAAEESDATISLLEQLLGAGFDKDITIKTINSTLILRSLQETFSTIDLAMIDLYNAELDLVKIGAPVSLIKKGKKVDVLKASTLPVGIVEDIQVESIQRKLEAGDFIIMMSDGLMDTVNSDINQEEWLKDVISKLDTKNPQEMADTILRTVKTASNNHIRDDMTVLVAKVWERS